MTDQENKNAQGAGGGSPVVMVEQSTASRHKPYRPTDLQEEGQTELHHKRSRAPAVPSVAEELKDSADNTDIKELKDDSVMTTEKQKHIVAKKLSLTTKRRGSSPEAISMTPLDVEVQRAEIVTVPSQPIPPSPTQESTDASLVAESEKKTAAVKDDEDSITEEIAELRTADPTQKASEWSDEEVAGGLPRSDSRASRVSRAVRQLFCCGVRYEPPSEENSTSSRTGFNYDYGI
ncbi:hypothetical protein B5X24_HaOG216229 [Helicoverpa armigera]|nr:hypothetical protein B5X24_HaOG216229 [Helicoverpa armigera]